MPCWVVPVVAAELWGVSLDHVLRRIDDGTVPSRQEYGFTLVDVAPDGAAPPTPARRPDEPPPLTFVLIQDIEPQPVVNWVPVEAVPVPPTPQADEADAELPPLDEEEDDVPIAHWREARSRVSRTRQPPKRVAPRAA